MCDLSSDPAGGLLFEADNGTLGSAGTFHLDLHDGSVTSATGGYSASVAADGTLVTIQCRYFSMAGSYEQPRLMTPAGAERALARVPSQRVGLQFSSVAISRDGRRIAGTRHDGSVRPSDALVLGRAAGSLTTVAWRLRQRRVFTGVQWRGEGDLIAGVSRSFNARTFNLYLVRSAGRSRSLLTSGVTAFATL